MVERESSKGDRAPAAKESRNLTQPSNSIEDTQMWEVYHLYRDLAHASHSLLTYTKCLKNYLKDLKPELRELVKTLRSRLGFEIDPLQKNPEVYLSQLSCFSKLDPNDHLRGHLHLPYDPREIRWSPLTIMFSGL